MRDANGSYYHPNPADLKSRVYVRSGPAGAEYRLWHADYPEVWEKHGWLAQETLNAAAALYREQGSGANPLLLYDAGVAAALLKEEERHV